MNFSNYLENKIKRKTFPPPPKVFKKPEEKKDYFSKLFLSRDFHLSQDFEISKKMQKRKRLIKIS